MDDWLERLDRDDGGGGPESSGGGSEPKIPPAMLLSAEDRVDPATSGSARGNGTQGGGKG